MHNYRVDAVPGHRIVKVTISGPLTLDDATKLGTAQAELVKKLAYADHTFAALIDGSTAPIQAMDVADAMFALSMRADFVPNRFAIVHGEGPVKMQVRRLNASSDRSFFATVDEAMVWLEAEARKRPFGK